MSTVPKWSYEYWLHGASVTWDGEAKAAYMHVYPSPDLFATARTVELGYGINVDLDTEGRVRGIEVIGTEIDESHLMLVLRHCSWAEDAS